MWESYPLLTYFEYKERGKLIRAITTKNSKIPSTIDTRLIFCRYREIYVEQKKLPEIEIEKRTIKSSNLIIPNKMPCITFKSEPEKIVKEQVAAAWIGLQPNALYIGIKKSPPPNPIPLNKPVRQLFYTTNFKFYSTLLF